MDNLESKADNWQIDLLQNQIDDLQKLFINLHREVESLKKKIENE